MFSVELFATSCKCSLLNGDGNSTAQRLPVAWPARCWQIWSTDFQARSGSTNTDRELVPKYGIHPPQRSRTRLLLPGLSPKHSNIMFMFRIFLLAVLTAAVFATVVVHQEMDGIQRMGEV